MRPATRSVEAKSRSSGSGRPARQQAGSTTTCVVVQVQPSAESRLPYSPGPKPPLAVEEEGGGEGLEAKGQHQRREHETADRLIAQQRQHLR